jgi:hypothetical protein
MKQFDQRWQTCATRARQAARQDEDSPFGFASRVFSRGFEAQPTPSDSISARQALAWLGGALAVLAVCSALELPHWQAGPPLQTGIENAVAQLVWSL